jgi:hypothetical protein
MTRYKAYVERLRSRLAEIVARQELVAFARGVSAPESLHEIRELLAEEPPNGEASASLPFTAAHLKHVVAEGLRLMLDEARHIDEPELAALVDNVTDRVVERLYCMSTGAEPYDLTAEQLHGMELWDRDVMLNERHRAAGALLVRMAVCEIRRHRCQIAPTEQGVSTAVERAVREHFEYTPASWLQVQVLRPRPLRPAS